MWLVLLILLAAAYIAAHALLRRRGAAWRGLSPSGPFLLWRTRRGRQFVERIAKPSRLWNAAGDAGIVLAVLTSIAVLGVLAARVVSTAQGGGGITPPTPGGLRGMLGLPGVNPMIPLGYGLAALTVAVVLHEGAHAVAAYANGMRLDSSGIVLLGLPIGAFVEPEPEGLHHASARARNRVIAAGPAANLTLAVASMLLLSILLASVHVVNDGAGLGIVDTLEGTPAEKAGLITGSVLMEADGKPLSTNRDLGAVLATKQPGDSLELVWMHGQEATATSLTLDAHPKDPERPLLGVSTVDLAYVQGTYTILTHPMRDGSDALDAGTRTTPPGSLLLYLTYPTLTFALGVDPFASPYVNFLEIDGVLAIVPLPFIAATATLLYWLFWTNVVLATFNALPFPLLDGGQLLRNVLREHLLRLRRIPPEATRPPAAEADDDLSPAAPEHAPELGRVRHRLQLLTRAAAVGTLLLLLAPPILARASTLV